MDQPLVLGHSLDEQCFGDPGVFGWKSVRRLLSILSYSLGSSTERRLNLAGEAVAEIVVRGICFPRFGCGSGTLLRVGFVRLDLGYGCHFSCSFREFWIAAVKRPRLRDETGLYFLKLTASVENLAYRYEATRCKISQIKKFRVVTVLG